MVGNGRGSVSSPAVPSASNFGGMPSDGGANPLIFGRGDEPGRIQHRHRIDRRRGEPMDEQGENRRQPDEPPRPPFAGDHHQQQRHRRRQRHKHQRPLKLPGQDNGLNAARIVSPCGVRPIRHHRRRQRPDDDQTQGKQHGGTITAESVACERMSLPREPVGYAAGLYAALHDLDAADVQRIIVAKPPDGDDWLAIRDRISRMGHR